MKQSESISIPLGVGTASLFEQSNTPTRPLPRLTLLMPYCPGEGADHPIPAHSMQLQCQQVEALYKLLHTYFNPTPPKGTITFNVRFTGEPQAGLRPFTEKVTVSCGSGEWQSTYRAKTLAEAEMYMKKWERDNWTMGLYPATEARIEHPDGYKREYTV